MSAGDRHLVDGTDLAPTVGDDAVDATERDSAGGIEERGCASSRTARRGVPRGLQRDALLVGAGVHDGRIQGGGALEGDVGAQGLTQADGEQLHLLRFSESLRSARQKKEAVGVVVVSACVALAGTAAGGSA